MSGPLLEIAALSSAYGQSQVLWDVDLTLAAARHWENGFVQVEYRA